MSGRVQRPSGVTLVELMIAIAVISIGILGFIGSYAELTQSLQKSKSQTLASNLAEQQMQIISQMDYYAVLATTAPLYDTSYSPSIPYDTVTFPLQTILQGGIDYTILTYVASVTEDPSTGLLDTLGPTDPDVGMKEVTVSVLWTEAGVAREYQTSTIIANYETSMTDCVISGTVESTSSSPISGAWVTFADDSGWQDSTNSSGKYSVSLSPGNYTMVVTATGYNPQLIQVAPSAGTNTQNVFLTPLSSGTVEGTAWMNTNLVISAVAGDTMTMVDESAPSGPVSVEYVELFNPTTSAIALFVPPASGESPWATSNGTELYQLDTYVGGEHYTDIANCSTCLYYSTYVPAGGYFLYGNYSSFEINNAWVTPDAYFGGSCSEDCVANDSYGIVQLIENSSTVDQVCWNGSSGPPPSSICGSNYLETDPSCGMETSGTLGSCTVDGDQAVRYSSMSWLDRGVYGSAYKSGDNRLDFMYPSTGSLASLGLNYNPFNSTASTLPVISGEPAAGANVSASDGLSIPTTAELTVSGASATFTLTGVATGTWSVFISSSGYLLENDTVTVLSTSPYVFASSTTILQTTDTQGYISGIVTNLDGTPISPAITVMPVPGTEGQSTTANTSNGRYLLRVTPGTMGVIANPSATNGNYVTLETPNVSVNLGEDTDGVNFILTQGGRISGFITRDGVNALPGIAVVALDSAGNALDTEVSGANGRFTTLAIASGTYTVEPEPDLTQTASPSAISVAVTNDATVFSDTFTISGALGTISGDVTNNGAAIASGVLIVISTESLGSPISVPSLSSSSLTGAPYYIGSSNESGVYSIEVEQSTVTKYNIYAFYPTVSGSSVTYSSQGPLTTTVTGGSTVSGENFSW